MKTAILTTLTLIGISSFANTTITIPVRLDTKESLATINEMLAKNGIPTIPAEISIRDSDNSSTIFTNLNESVSKSLSKLGEKFAYNSTVFGNVPNSSICYSGDAMGVANTLQSLADIAFSDQMGVIGFRYQNEVRILDENGDDLVEYLNKNSKEWKNWDTTSSSVLVLTRYSDEGDDINPAIISVCKTSRKN